MADYSNNGSSSAAGKCPVDHSSLSVGTPHARNSFNGTSNNGSTAPLNGHSNGSYYGSKSKQKKKSPPLAKKQTRKDVDDTFSKFASLIHASNRPIPNRYGDGRDHDADEVKRTGLRQDIKALRKGGFLGESLKTIRMYLAHAREGGAVDDKTMLVSFPLEWGRGWWCYHSFEREGDPLSPLPSNSPFRCFSPRTASGSYSEALYSTL